MKKKRTLPTRRKRALRWLAVLGLLVLTGYGLGLYCVTPGQAVDRCAARYALADLELWTEVDMPQTQEGGRQRWLLAWQEDCMLLSRVSFQLLRGWTAEPVTLVMDDGEGPLSAGYGEVLWEIETGYQTQYLFFGFVRDEEVTAVTAEVFHSSMTADETGCHLERFPAQRTRLPARDFQRLGDRRGFLLLLDPVYDPGGSTYPEIAVLVSRADGTTEMVEEITSGLNMR